MPIGTDSDTAHFRKLCKEPIMKMKSDMRTTARNTLIKLIMETPDAKE
jgi:hypothetical protein